MSDVQFTDEFGFPLSSSQALLRQRQGVRPQTGATERAGLVPIPVTVHQLSEDTGQLLASEKPPAQPE